MEQYIRAEITINGSKERVWDALVNPEMTARYMFGCRTVSDWQQGSTLDWVGQADGKDITYVTGRVITYEPFTTLVYSVIDPFAEYPKTEENHLIVSCHLTEENGATLLSVSQGDYTTVAEGEKRYGHGGDGWAQLLSTIKELVESAG